MYFIETLYDGGIKETRKYIQSKNYKLVENYIKIKVSKNKYSELAFYIYDSSDILTRKQLYYVKYDGLQYTNCLKFN